MAFCTIVEWDQDVSQALAHMPGNDSLPAGALVRVYGGSESGAYAIEVWESSDDARRFEEKSAPALEQSSLPPPTRVNGYPSATVLIRQGA
jgi:hypothetical protein